jgi:hypothetical protein
MYKDTQITLDKTEQLCFIHAVEHIAPSSQQPEHHLRNLQNIRSHRISFAFGGAVVLSKIFLQGVVY